VQVRSVSTGSFRLFESLPLGPSSLTFSARSTKVKPTHSAANNLVGNIGNIFPQNYPQIVRFVGVPRGRHRVLLRLVVRERYFREDARRKIMALHLGMAARTRLVTLGNNICPQCNAHLLAPDWSEHVNERRVRHAWSCDACGYEFETMVVFPSGR
jgi:hypothetical protein